MILVGFIFGITAEEILKGAEDLMRGTTSVGSYRMEVIRPDYQTIYEMSFWEERGGDRSLVVITKSSTGKDDGTVFLKKEGNLWMYLPKAGKKLRMPPSMMMDPWMGSDLTNDDLVHESSISEDYDSRIVSEEPLSDGTRYTLELIPREGAPVVWGKIVFVIEMPGYIAVRGDYYDEDGKRVRTIKYSGVKTIGGRRLPTLMEVIPGDKPGHKTVLTIIDIKFNTKIPAERFDVNQMERWSGE
ncbi:MAG: outer membrane lipoprotein-sorting protein [candidate division WOR-3 bacterium]